MRRGSERARGTPAGFTGWKRWLSSLIPALPYVVLSLGLLAGCAPSGPPVSAQVSGKASPVSSLASPQIYTAPSASLLTASQTAPAISSTPIPRSPTPSSTPESLILSTLQSPRSTLSSPTCSPDLCQYPERLVLSRPIAPPGRDTIDDSYRFGTTQGGQRDPHHGVEFLNSQGTPVLAAAEGQVVVAGDDRKTFYGLYSYFYGNLVVLKHSLPWLDQPLFTLYGHLSKIEVQAGDVVRLGQEIGQVGMTGVATGSHLHFEVRLGDNTYKNSRNPELWLAPLSGPDGSPMGALAGRILDPQGNLLKVESIVLDHLPSPDGPVDFTLYLETYEEKALLGQSPYEDSFASGDLPAGWYRISFVQNGMQSRVVQVLPGQLAVVTFRVGGS